MNYIDHYGYTHVAITRPISQQELSERRRHQQRYNEARVVYVVTSYEGNNEYTWTELREEADICFIRKSEAIKHVMNILHVTKNEADSYISELRLFE